MVDGSRVTRHLADDIWNFKHFLLRVSESRGHSIYISFIYGETWFHRNTICLIGFWNPIKTGVFGDSYSLQVAANYLRRNIIIIPSKIEYAHNPYGYISIESFNVDNSLEPIYLFYYEEHVYGTGHYQSIREGINNEMLSNF